MKERKYVIGNESIWPNTRALFEIQAQGLLVVKLLPANLLLFVDPKVTINRLCSKLEAEGVKNRVEATRP